MNTIGRGSMGYYVDKHGERKYYSESGNKTRMDVFFQQVKNKLHPGISVIHDYAHGSTRFGGKQTRVPGSAMPNAKWVVDEFLPIWSALSVQEGKEIMQDENLSHQGWMYTGFVVGLGILGAGSYDPEAEEDAEEYWFDWQNPN